MISSAGLLTPTQQSATVVPMAMTLTQEESVLLRRVRLMDRAAWLSTLREIRTLPEVK